MTTWRPRNESPEDLARENAAVARINAKFRTEHVKLSETIYSIDWAFSRSNELICWGEYKWRSKRYDTLILGAGKWLKGLSFSRDSGKPFNLFVEWPGGLFWLKANEHQDLPIIMAGNSRGQNGDIEPCVDIPTHLFKRVA